jgi:glucokinase
MALRPLLIGDLGGTNARFALADPRAPRYSQLAMLPCADYETPEQAIAAYLAQAGAPAPAVICLAVAGVVVEQRVRFLNNHWSLDARSLQRRFAGAEARLLNDFEAISLSLPLLGEADLEPVGPARPDFHGRDDYSLAVIGPGTGLGTGGLLCRGGERTAVTGEGGHVGFAPVTHRQLRLLETLWGRFERVSNERLLCGPGIENIHAAVREMRGEPAAAATAAEIFQRAQDHADDSATETVGLFFEALGQAAGDLALTIGALDGVFIGGGIVGRYPELLKSGSFRSGFENKGRYRSLMERIPTSLITHDQPGLLGASHMARRMARTAREAE